MVALEDGLTQDQLMRLVRGKVGITVDLQSGKYVVRDLVRGPGLGRMGVGRSPRQAIEMMEETS